ncbi:hypothetical protein HDC29_000239 [Sphingopyxis sp. JAI108]|nr:hypothetical protein [Sphingopyxis sp. JAI108]
MAEARKRRTDVGPHFCIEHEAGHEKYLHGLALARAA